jgi:hypothetical protein
MTVGMVEIIARVSEDDGRQRAFGVWVHMTTKAGWAVAMAFTSGRRCIAASSRRSAGSYIADWQGFFEGAASDPSQRTRAAREAPRTVSESAFLASASTYAATAVTAGQIASTYSMS